mmetsp:Transcript_149153/g.275292  ORF Transcript_149153/g.275292 Transcript_149153/m.275292 type:complete len:248 (+) Transcript_149153:395-1138(+)
MLPHRRHSSFDKFGKLLGNGSFTSSSNSMDAAIASGLSTLPIIFTSPTLAALAADPRKCGNWSSLELTEAVLLIALASSVGDRDGLSAPCAALLVLRREQPLSRGPKSLLSSSTIEASLLVLLRIRFSELSVGVSIRGGGLFICPRPSLWLSDSRGAIPVSSFCIFCRAWTSGIAKLPPWERALERKNGDSLGPKSEALPAVLAASLLRFCTSTPFWSGGVYSWTPKDPESSPRAEDNVPFALPGIA